MYQFPKTLAILVGGYRPDAAWMTDHIERVKFHYKKVFYYLIVSAKNTRHTPSAWRSLWRPRWVSSTQC
jgi:hypothetical protein